MNAIARSIAREQTIIDLGLGLALAKASLLIVSLVFAVILSALAVIYVKDHNRQLIGEMQRLQRQTHQLAIEKDKLLLEQGALTTQARVQKLAEQRLQMILPPADVVRMVRP